MYLRISYFICWLTCCVVSRSVWSSAVWFSGSSSWAFWVEFWRIATSTACFVCLVSYYCSRLWWSRINFFRIAEESKFLLNFNLFLFRIPKTPSKIKLKASKLLDLLLSYNFSSIDYQQLSRRVSHSQNL